ncbi:MAG: homoserine dehydrogenase [Clostridiales bacterium]|jgi:homoserine dehydrogenase|nr:homoserine dehydrogenase [Clostridiales bacterium]
MKVAIMGFGVVGSGVAELFAKNHNRIVSNSTQSELELKYILDIRDFPDSPFAHMMIKDFNIILDDPEVGIVVETMGGLKPAYDFVSACLKAKKSVVTSNKELVAEKGYELLTLAEENGVNFLFEASVGGGIPIIRPISQCLAANEIAEIAGILNGTTNFILTKMINEGMSFADALKLAQQYGYAESNPAADIEGTDACRKICILASLSFGRHVYPDEVYTEGITKLTSADVEYAKNWGGVVKLIARAGRVDNGKIFAMVSPAFVKESSQLASVDDVFNAILVRGDATGDVVFYGRGAGKMPTASAVVADVIDCAKHTAKKKLFGWDDSQKDYVVDYRTLTVSLYVRVSAVGKTAEIKKQLEAKLPGIKYLVRNAAPENEFAFVTPEMPEKDIKEKLSEVEGISILGTIRITDY